MICQLNESHITEGFDCGGEAMNNYLPRHALVNQQKLLIGVTYVAVSDEIGNQVLGYFTLATASIARSAMPAKNVRGLPPYDLPLILLARLAVDKRAAGQKLGNQLLAEALRISLRVSDTVGCRYMVTDAYADRVSWYAQFGFIALATGSGSESVKMILDLRTARMAE